ncbi:putative uridine kinase C227.14 [Selaginella moellendorffii]|uniref:putative uridine kinase C227.14 n=1 Tax=Selaginella moellendorffii TaxID=88036 RepID=UPI000D1CF879|nr:putative uridine kinase C227.14 [Selaginella moellendorffii]|eukprot:XP_024535263.1 putative uridine kinase C227.14 [Selaginella moellendorffii]
MEPTAALVHGSFLCYGAADPSCSSKALVRGVYHPNSRFSLGIPIQYKTRRTSPLKIFCSTVDEQITLQASTMHETYDLLAHRLFGASSAKPGSKYLVGIAGPPGAGKSTLANEVSGRVNKLHQERNPGLVSEIAIAVPMDGFHLYKHQLDAMEDPEEAHARRGAPWTFNPSGLVDCLKALRSQQWAYFPSFDHGVGDPVEQDILVSPKHKVVLVEGNYLLLEDGEWKELKNLFDERWFISLDLDTAMKRVELRHISTGKTKEHAKSRVEYNDRPNAELILTTRKHSNLVINSLDHSQKKTV